MTCSFLAVIGGLFGYRPLVREGALFLFDKLAFFSVGG